MTAPHLVHVDSANGDVTNALQCLPPATRQRVSAVFSVARSGVFWGRRWARNEIVVCGDPAEEQRLLVLIAHGMGRPRLGSLREADLYGDCDEPCSRSRWQAVGQVLAVLRRPLHRGEGMVGPSLCEVWEPPRDAGYPRPVPVSDSQKRVSAQLRLFAA